MRLQFPRHSAAPAQLTGENPTITRHRSIGDTLQLFNNSTVIVMARYKRGLVKTGPLAGLEHKKANFVIEYAKDFSPRRAAEASGFAADHGYRLREEPEIAAAIDLLIATRLESSDIDAEWVLMEAVDNALIAKQLGNISASNTALQIVGKHVMVDAFAADKVQNVTHQQVMDRLRRARDRLQGDPEELDDDPVSFM